MFLVLGAAAMYAGWSIRSDRVFPRSDRYSHSLRIGAFAEYGRLHFAKTPMMPWPRREVAVYKVSSGADKSFRSALGGAGVVVVGVQDGIGALKSSWG